MGKMHFFYKKHKKLLRRITCFTLAIAFFTNNFPMNQIAKYINDSRRNNINDFIGKDFDGVNNFTSLFSDNSIIAEAEDVDGPSENTGRSAQTINITTDADLIAYANGTNAEGYRHDDTLSIELLADFTLSGSDFPGIGSKSAPFAGNIIIGKIDPANGAPYGDMNRLTLNGASLFNYVSTDAQFYTTGNSATPIILNASGDSAVPIFARHITTGSSSNTWDIVLNVNNYKTGGLIGSIDSGTVTISLSNLSAGPVEGSASIGAICGALEANSTLNLSVNSSCVNAGGTSVTCASFGNVTTTTNSAHAGGLVGHMKSGSTLSISDLPSFSSERTISATGNNAHAGGLVGYCDCATVSFTGGATYSDSNANTIIGKTGAGGVFGYYALAAGTIQPLDSSVYSITGSNTITASGQSAGGFIGVLKNNGTLVSSSRLTISGGTFTSTLNSNYSGGLIGKYTGNALENTLIINGVNSTSTRSNGTYGGFIGYMESAFVQTSGANAISVNGAAGTSGGIVGQIKNSFLDVSGENTITGSIQAGVLHTMTDSCVIRLSGKTDLSGMTATLKKSVLNAIL